MAGKAKYVLVMSGLPGITKVQKFLLIRIFVSYIVEELVFDSRKDEIQKLIN